MKIRIDNLRVYTRIGTYEWERHAPQEVLVTVELELTHDKATRSDALADSVDYAALCEQITELGHRSAFLLIERLAGEILALVLENPLVGSSTVALAKPPALPNAESVSVIVSGTNS